MLEKLKTLKEKNNLITFLVVAVAVIVAYKVIMNFENAVRTAVKGVSFLFDLLTPFIIGALLAYLLNPAVKFFEDKLYGKAKRLAKVKLPFSIITVYALAVVVVTLILNTIIPILVKSIVDLASQMPVYFDKLLEFRNGDWNHSVVGRLLYNAIGAVENSITQILNGKDAFFLNPAITDIFSKLLNATGTVIDVIFGVVISIYIILEKKNLARGIKKVLKAFSDDDTSSRIVFYATQANSIFSKFIVGQSVDSLIIGIMCMIGLGVLDVNNAILYGAIIGVTNMIPYFGPFIGAIPVVALVLFESPLKALWVALFILALQQFDSMVMAPKIIGESIDLSPFWISLAILIGGGLFGVIGMFLGAPAMAFLLFVINRYLTKRIENKRKTDINND